MAALSRRRQCVEDFPYDTMSVFYFFIFMSLVLFNIVPIAAEWDSQPEASYLKLRLFQPTPTSTGPHDALLRDTLRVASLSSTSPAPSAVASPVVSGASAGLGQYLVELRIGTPLQKLLLVADTGSDLVWAHCSACHHGRCLHRHPPGSAFFPRRSSSFRPFHCYDAACRSVPPAPGAGEESCDRSSQVHTPCRYRYTYSDRSSSSGFFSRESAAASAISSTPAGAPSTPVIRFPSLSFGCAFNVSGISFPRGGPAQGVMGLGRGPTSFPSQIGRRFEPRFSYCLLDYTLAPTPTSYLIIGNGGGKVPSVGSSSSNLTFRGRARLSVTPLLRNSLSPTFYYVSLESVSVDGVPLPVDPSVFALDNATGTGGTVVDSGTTLSFLPEQAYRQILAAMERVVRLPRVSLGVGAAGAGRGGNNGGGGGGGAPAFDLCVNVTGLGGKQLPRLALHMAGGAVLSPPPRNYFIQVADGVKCLALQPLAPTTSGGGGGGGGGGRGRFGVIGNLMQQGFLFDFDLANDRLGFSRTGCSDQAH